MFLIRGHANQKCQLRAILQNWQKWGEQVLYYSRGHQEREWPSIHQGFYQFCNVNAYRFSKTLVKYYHTSENFPGVTCRSGHPLFYATIESCTDIYHEPSKFLLPYSFVYWSFLLYSKLFVDRGHVFSSLCFCYLARDQTHRMLEKINGQTAKKNSESANPYWKAIQLEH